MGPNDGYSNLVAFVLFVELLLDDMSFFEEGLDDDDDEVLGGFGV